ncbi:MAG TPA: ATP synthase F0 subunit B [Candidatus Binatia bacterium]|nr:ATP synthase F0 subunit B [Candidatus Binatia bacterium]
MRRDARAMALSSLLLLGSAPALAASGAGDHGNGHSAAAWLTLAFSFVNFFIFSFVMYRFAWPALRDFLVNRSRELQEAMSVAANAREEAERIRREYAVKEAALGETRRAMIEELRESAERDRERLLEEARLAGERLRADAERRAESELARARRELRAEAARLAAEIAERDIRSRLGDADQSRLVQEFVEGVSQS